MHLYPKKSESEGRLNSKRDRPSSALSCYLTAMGLLSIIRKVKAKEKEVR